MLRNLPPQCLLLPSGTSSAKIKPLMPCDPVPAASGGRRVCHRQTAPNLEPNSEQQPRNMLAFKLGFAQNQADATQQEGPHRCP